MQQRYSVEINWRHPHTALGFAVMRRDSETVKRFVSASYRREEAERIAEALNEKEAA